MLIGSSALEANQAFHRWAELLLPASIYFKNGPQLCSAGPHRISSKAD
jgi:hypothetical protein